MCFILSLDKKYIDKLQSAKNVSMISDERNFYLRDSSGLEGDIVINKN